MADVREAGQPAESYAWVRETRDGRLLDPKKPERGRVRVVHVLPLPEDSYLVPVVVATGRVEPWAIPKTIGPQPVWGCAICEQFHPVEVKHCPLVGRECCAVVLGPYETDKGTLYLTARQLVSGSGSLT